jgi:broad specificity phosphatase PhoE
MDVYSAPPLRARETAAIVAGHLGLSVDVIASGFTGTTWGASAEPPV